MIEMRNPWKRRLAIIADIVLQWVAPLLVGRTPASIPARPRVLLIRCDHIGDAVLATPVLRPLREALDASRLDVLAGPWAASIFENHPAVDGVIRYATPWWAETRGATFRERMRAWLDLPSVISTLRAGKYDIAIDLRGDLRQIVFFLALGGAGERVSSDRTGGVRYLTRTWTFEPYRHEVEKNQAIVALLGVTETGPLDVAIPDALPPDLEKDLATLAGGYVTFSLRGTEENRSWPPEHAARLSELVHEELGLATVMIGGEGDRALGEAIRAASKAPVLNFAARTTLPDALGVLKRAECAVAVDSGPMHLAAAAGTQVVALFGAGNPAESRPWSPAAEITTLGSPCGCRHPWCDFKSGPGRCMVALKPERVLAAVRNKVKYPAQPVPVESVNAQRLTVLNAGQNYFVRGGSDRYQTDMGLLLAAHGHRIIPFAAANERNIPSSWESFFPRGANFIRPGPRDISQFIYNPGAADSLDQVLRRTRIDIAHLHIYYGKLTASILGPLRRAGIPIVQTLHEYKLVCPVYTLVSNGEICEKCEGKHFYKAVVNRCNRGSIARSALSSVETYVSHALGAVKHVDQFIAVSDFVRLKMIELGVPAAKITTVYNFTDVSGIAPSREPGSYLLYVGRLEAVKGMFTLIDAAERLPKVQVKIVGDGPARAEMEKRIAERGLTNVEMLGFRSGEELQQLVRGSICSMLPSEWYETFGLTMLEGFAHGRAALASRIGGLPEVVDDRVDGLLFEAGDVDDLTEKMAWMAAHPTEAAEMGMRGRRKVETRFGAAEHYEALMNVYRRVLA